MTAAYLFGVMGWATHRFIFKQKISAKTLLGRIMAKTDRTEIRGLHYASTSKAIETMSPAMLLDADRREKVSAIARKLVIESRERSDESGTLDALLREFG